MSLALLCSLSVSFAQVWTTEATGVITPQPGTITENGIGSPTVAWDAAMERYVLFFETQLAPAGGDCTAGSWGIGAASSADGLNWDVYPDPIVAPTPDTPYRCVAAHPSVTIDGGTYHLYFKAEQGLNACAGGNKPWGCNNYSGIGHATVVPQLDDFTVEIAQLEADIVATELAEDTAMDVFATSMNDYRDTLIANQAEFACDGTAPLCTPCGLSELTATFRSTVESVTFCQGFEFAIPTEMTGVELLPRRIPVVYPSGAHTFTLQVTPETGLAYNCTYRKNGNVWVLDKTPNNGTFDNKCSNNFAGGTQVTATALSIRLTPDPLFPSERVGGGISLSATNLGEQSFSGGVFDTMVTLDTTLSTYDVASTIVAIPQLTQDLTELSGWLESFPADPERTSMAVDTAVFSDDAFAVYDELLIYEDQLDTMNTQLTTYLGYVQNVTVALTSGVSAQLNAVFGYPSVMKVGSDWIMMVQQYPNIRRATAPSPDGPFTLDAANAIAAGQVSWGMTEVFDPNLVCQGGPVPYQAYFGGRTLTGGVITDGGISDAISTDAVTWLANIATRFIGWTDANSYRHFDVIRSTDGQYRMWYAEKVGGKNQVSVGSTTATWNDALSQQRVCP